MLNRYLPSPSFAHKCLGQAPRLSLVNRGGAENLHNLYLGKFSEKFFSEMLTENCLKGEGTT